MEKIGDRKGVGLSEGHANKRQSSDKALLGAIRDEITALQSASAVAQADANAQTGAYVQADVQSIADLANANKAALNAIANIAKLFEK